MRIAFGGYEHETNTFSNLPVTAAHLERITLRGQALVNSGMGVRSTIGGVLDECAALGIEAVPAMYAEAGPSAATEQAAFEGFLKEFVDRLWAAHCEKPLDAIALTIHGAGVADGYPDMESAHLQALRARFGKDMPIGMVLDLHGNITPEMMERSDITVGFQCYPHTDTYESARLLIRLLHEQHVTGKRLYQALVQLPLHIAPAFGVTLSGPAHDVMEYDQQLVKKDPALRDVTFFHGFPYSDVAFSGASVTAVAETPEAAQRAAQQAAQYAWSRRKDFLQPTYSAEQAMDLAQQSPGPVVINEGSDNPGGGAPGDGTHLLREMLKRDLPGSAYGFITDPEVVRQAVAAGVGTRIDCLLGGKTDDRHGAPIELKGALVKTISDGVYVKKNPMGAGGIGKLGTTVLLQAGNVSIVVAAGRRQTMDDAPFRLAGIDWQDMRILALKSAQHFKGWWVGRAKTIIPCDSPGIQSADLAGFDYQHLNTDYFPLGDRQWQG